MLPARRSAASERRAERAADYPDCAESPKNSSGTRTPPPLDERERCTSASALFEDPLLSCSPTLPAAAADERCSRLRTSLTSYRLV